MIRDEQFWLPLVGLFSGMRQEEICQLQIEDIRQESGVWIFDVNARSGKQLKNATAVRLVPIHSTLQRIGFLEYVADVRKAGHARLFYQLIGGGADNRLGHGYSELARAAVARLMLTEVQALALAPESLKPGRLFSNLLSSVPMSFNLFAPMALDLDLAAKVFRSLLPHLDIRKVTALRFEHSPGRDDPAMTQDRTAFDVAVRYERSDGATGFLGFECKYSESMNEAGKCEPSPRLDELASTSGLFKNPGSAVLRVAPLHQLFRTHLLAQASLTRQDYAEATFVLVGPRHNDAVQRAADLYTAHLAERTGTSAGFINIELEAVIEAIGWAGRMDDAAVLFDRYCDWRHVDGAVAEELRRHNYSWSAIAPAPATPILKLIAAAR